MKEFAGSPFWRSIAVGLVLGLLLIGMGLFRQSPVSLTAPAHASQLVDMARADMRPQALMGAFSTSGW